MFEFLTHNDAPITTNATTARPSTPGSIHSIDSRDLGISLASTSSPTLIGSLAPLAPTASASSTTPRSTSAFPVLEPQQLPRLRRLLRLSWCPWLRWLPRLPRLPWFLRFSELPRFPSQHPWLNNIPSVADRVYECKQSVSSHLEAHWSVGTVLYTPLAVGSLLYWTVACPTSSTVHRRPRCSITDPPNLHHIRMLYSHRSNAMFFHAIIAVVIITSGHVILCALTWTMVFSVSITVIDLCLACGTEDTNGTCCRRWPHDEEQWLSRASHLLNTTTTATAITVTSSLELTTPATVVIAPVLTTTTSSMPSLSSRPGLTSPVSCSTNTYLYTAAMTGTIDTAAVGCHWEFRTISESPISKM